MSGMPCVIVDGYVFPDIAKIMLDRLAQPAPIVGNYNLPAVGEAALRQLADTKNGPSLRLSASGGCERALAYSWHNWTSPDSIDAASRMTFMVGDATETILVVALAESIMQYGNQFGLRHFGAAQTTVGIPVAIDAHRSVTIDGHPDGIMMIPLRNTEDGEYDSAAKAILEVKSMSDYAFKKFRAEGLTEDNSYYSQVQAYMLATGAKYTYIVAYGKQVGTRDAEILSDEEENIWRKVAPLHGQWVREDPKAQREILERFQKVIISKSPDNFPRIEPNKKGKLGFPCTYCKYLEVCQPNTTHTAEESKWLQKSTKICTYVQSTQER